MASSVVGLVRLEAEDIRSAMIRSVPCESWRQQGAGDEEEQPEGLRYPKDVGGRPDRHVYGGQFGVGDAQEGGPREREARKVDAEGAGVGGRRARDADVESSSGAGADGARAA